MDEEGNIKMHFWIIGYTSMHKYIIQFKEYWIQNPKVLIPSQQNLYLTACGVTFRIWLYIRFMISLYYQLKH